MKELIDKYFVFTVVTVILTAILFVFGANNENILSMIVGAFVGLIAAPKSNS